MSRDRVVLRPRASSVDDRLAIVERARRRGFHRFVVASGEGGPPSGDDWTMIEDENGLHPPGAGSARVEIHRVDSESALTAALRTASPGGTVAIEWAGDRVIPLENAVAARGRSFSLWAIARAPREVPGALGALEHGADLVIVDVSSPEEVDLLEAIVEGPLPRDLPWTLVPVVGVQPAGVGDRVIVDTTSLLGIDEGMFVGSSAALLLHVASEATGSRFSRPRPFRVNAGSAHSYVLMADGSTRYLAELSAGDAVLVATPGGSSRSVRVGRIKTERRPLVQVTVTDEDRPRTLFAQEAESVRLSSNHGLVATTDLAAGARLHALRLPPGRHLGAVVEETVEER
jgi:3-dehydroquinate synthase II